VSATLSEFAQVKDSAAATRSKLAKQAVLAEYLRPLSEPDLRLAVRYAAGRAFPATDSRNLNVGGAIISDVILDLLRIDPREFHATVVRSGEIGEALATVWPSREAVGQSMTLRDLADAFADLARSGAYEHKRAILTDLFRRCQHGREAAYLAKIIFGDMRSGVQEGVLQAAVAQAFDKPPAAVQRCQLLVGDLEEVAALAKEDALETATFHLFHPIQFMLATPQETPGIAVKTMGGRGFYAEDKLDGIRAQVHKSGDRVEVYTRTMSRADEAFPDVVEAIRKVSGDFLLDGEIVPFCDGCVLPFAHIQKRLGRKALTPRIIRENPAVFIAFDILYHDGRLLMDEPLRRRKEALRSLCAGGSLQCAEFAEVSAADAITMAFDAARRRRNEGIVLKDPESWYAPGRRGQAWLKLKTHLPTLDCVVTAAEYGHGKRRNVLSDYTFAVWDREPADPEARLVNIGKAYSGLTDEQIHQLTELIQKIAVQQYGHVFVVRPQVVLEIACDQIQKSSRHASGYAMRFPRIKRIRWDKRPEDADRLSRVAAVYESFANTAHRHAPKLEAVKAEPTLFDGLESITRAPSAPGNR
jgi:DNA ligase-1